MKEVIEKILEFVLGHKYYANVINPIGTFNYEISCFIFRTKKEADEHRETVNRLRSFNYIETISFRSRREY